MILVDLKDHVSSLAIGRAASISWHNALNNHSVFAKYSYGQLECGLCQCAQIDAVLSCGILGVVPR